MRKGKLLNKLIEKVQPLSVFFLIGETLNLVIRGSESNKILRNNIEFLGYFFLTSREKSLKNFKEKKNQITISLAPAAYV